MEFFDCSPQLNPRRRVRGRYAVAMDAKGPMFFR